MKFTKPLIAPSSAVFLDISKAFAKVWHDGLIFNLKQNGGKMAFPGTVYFLPLFFFMKKKYTVQPR